MSGNTITGLDQIPTTGSGGLTFNLGGSTPALPTWMHGTNAAISGIGSLAQAYSAYKQYELGKDTLRQNREAFNINLANQAKITNAQIDDRALRRAAENPYLTGDLSRIQAAAEASAARRRVSGEGI